MPNSSGWIRLAGAARLDALLARERALGSPALPLDAAASLLAPVAAALARRHAGGRAHLGVEPRAIAVVRAPAGCRAELLDPRSPPGSSPYRAPEQRCEAYGVPGPWTDVFSLALVFVEVASHVAPEACGLDGIATALESLGRLGVPPPVQGAIARALSVYPAERYQTAASFWRSLSLPSAAAPAVSGGTPIAARSS